MPRRRNNSSTLDSITSLENDPTETVVGMPASTQTSSSSTTVTNIVSSTGSTQNPISQLEVLNPCDLNENHLTLPLGAVGGEPVESDFQHHQNAGVKSNVSFSCQEKCCVPGSCLQEDAFIDSSDLGDNVRVLCSNEACEQGNWMHQACFSHWEQSLLTFLRNSGRARSWSEKQRIQNLWTKKGYDLIFKACECCCGRGHLRKDIDYVPLSPGLQPNLPDLSANQTGNNNRNRRRGKRRNEKPEVVMITGRGGPNTHLPNDGAYYPHHHVNGMTGHYNSSSLARRMRTRQLSSSSTASTGTFSSSPLDEEFSPPLSPDFPTLEEEDGISGRIRGNRSQQHRRNSGSVFSLPPDTGNGLARGNIFRQRRDYLCFQGLPGEKQNSYHIHMEDDSCNGNDDTKAFLLTNLTAHRAVSVTCLVCRASLPVYDHFPLINGTFFLSPLSHDDTVCFPIACPGERTTKYLHVVCMQCLLKPMISCMFCQKKWSGQQLIIGSMYSYDIFASAPCCYQRLSCKKCAKVALTADSSGALKYFSQYSQRVDCPHCQTTDFHFVKRVADSYQLPNSRSGGVGTPPTQVVASSPVMLMPQNLVVQCGGGSAPTRA